MASAAARCSRRQPNQIIKVAAIQRELHNLGVVDRRCDGPFSRLKQFGFGLHIDCFRDLAYGQIEGEIQRTGDTQSQVLLHLLLEVRSGHLYAVRSRNQRQDGEVAALTRDGLSGDTRLYIGSFDSRVRNRGSGRIDHSSYDLSQRGSLARSSIR